jgi:hypothetical protein
MHSNWIKTLSRTMALFFLAIFLISPANRTTAQPSPDQQTLWSLEHDYFGYVESNNLTAYLSLWHNNFLGWPSVSPAPVRKDHITDWITSQTSKGLVFKLLKFEPAAIQVTGNIGVTAYWTTYKFADKNGVGESYRTRITHTWLRDGENWHIVGGMSMPETAQALSKPEVPAKLSPPEGEKVILQAHAIGFQVYACQAAADQKLAWTLKAPEAELFDANGKSIGKHHAGPTWIHMDGSEVVGKLAAKEDSPAAGAIPWLLLAAVSHSGNGILTNVTSIQRIHTEGGQPPASGCDTSHTGTETKSKYSADYYFYTATH